MQKNVIINGNCISEMKTMSSNSIGLIVADPPPCYIGADRTLFQGYHDDEDGKPFETWEEYEKFSYQWLTACHRILKPNGSIWIMGGMKYIHTVGYIMQKIGFYLINEVVWQKNSSSPNFKGKRLCNSHEILLWATKNKNFRFTFCYDVAKVLNANTINESGNNICKSMTSVWYFPVCSAKEVIKEENGKRLYMAQKPQELLERMILISSIKGDTILDPFGGTMTTAAAAKKLGRNYIMIEQNKKYCQFGEKRLSQICCEEEISINAGGNKR